MRVVVIGGSGQIGSMLVTELAEQGHEAVAASPSTGVNTLTGAGLAGALAGASVVIDVSNLRSSDAGALLEFFETSTRNLLASEYRAGVGHHVALSVVGADRMPGSGYMRAKVAQEKEISGSSVPATIVRATQFFEFVGRIAAAATVDGVIRVPPALIQPIAALDVVAALARISLRDPSGAIEIGGPEPFTFERLLRTHAAATGDPRKVVVDPHARYFGAELAERTLVPGDGATLSETTYVTWLETQADAGNASR
jgi:uncharacterized protein YbjT (DUF2867 family)